MLPSLENAQPTLHNLYAVERLIGAIRQIAFNKQPNYLHLGMKVVPEGLSTNVLPHGGEVRLDMRRLALVYLSDEAVEQRIELEGKTQALLLEKLLAMIYARELTDDFPSDGDTSYTEAMFAGTEGIQNRSIPSRAHTTENEALHFDARQAIYYADALYSIFTAMARFRARLNGAMTPLVVWPEHFDMSFIWFAADSDENHPHLNFGFAPYSAGIDEPYLYAYAYPYPEAFDPPPLPPGARWHTAGWTGVVLPYAEIARQYHPEAYVEAACLAMYRALRSLLRS